MVPEPQEDLSRLGIADGRRFVPAASHDLGTVWREIDTFDRHSRALLESVVLEPAEDLPRLGVAHGRRSVLAGSSDSGSVRGECRKPDTIGMVPQKPAGQQPCKMQSGCGVYAIVMDVKGGEAEVSGCVLVTATLVQQNSV